MSGLSVIHGLSLSSLGLFRRSVAIACLSVTFVGCSTSVPRISNVPDNSIDGFHVYVGDCLNKREPAGNAAAALIPLMQALVAAGIKAGGAALTKVGEDKTAGLVAAANVTDWPVTHLCVHLVDGPVYVTQNAFIQDSTLMTELLPLPWNMVTKRRDDLEADVRTVLNTNGIWLASRPRFYAELGVIVRNNAYLYRLRALYYGQGIGAKRGTWGKPQSLRLVVAPFNGEQSMLATLTSSQGIEIEGLSPGSSLIFQDFIGETEALHLPWETSWIPIPQKPTGSSTLVVGVIEAIPGQKWARVVGGALTGSADATAQAVADRYLDQEKIDAAEQKKQAAVATARGAAALAINNAVEDWADARRAYIACVDASLEAKGEKWVEFVKTRAKAALSIANAPGARTAIGKDNLFFIEEDSANCAAPKRAT